MEEKNENLDYGQRDSAPENERMAKKKVNKRIYIELAVLLVCLIVFGIILSIQYKAPKKISSASVNKNNEVDSENGENYYSAGVNNLEKKQYGLAIEMFDQAIKFNPNEAKYYVSKSDAEYMNGEKEKALETVILGLENCPDDEYLKSKRDVLEKNDFTPSVLDATRE